MGKAVVLFPFVLWMVLLILVPLALIAYYAFTKSDGNILQFSFENFKSFIRPDLLLVLARSLKLSLIATAICLFAGYPVAMILAGNTFKKKALLLVLFIAPMWMNFLLRTYAWLTLLEGTGVINTILDALGLGTHTFLGNENAVVFGMVYNLLPYMIFPIYSSICKISPNILEAAEDLGSNAYTRFTRIILPLSIPGVLSGITMVFVPGVTTFVISQFLGSGNVILIGDIIEQQFTRASNWGFGAAISIVVMIVVFICMWIINRFTDEPEVTML
ncbi:MAG: ABC transporter permease [Clostridia bacterium]|nr:ABC transporter permease [Clostridia bacterium]